MDIFRKKKMIYVPRKILEHECNFYGKHFLLFPQCFIYIYSFISFLGEIGCHNCVVKSTVDILGSS